MKKIPIILSLVFLLAACSSNGSTSSSTSSGSSSSENLPIQVDELDHSNVLKPAKENWEYTIDDSISNKNGSMGYEIFVRSFYDTNKDGIGDLKGVETKLPYLADLGIKTIWLMPIHPAMSYHGYDITDYYNVDSQLGTMTDFDNLVTKANEYNIDIMLDFVINHSGKNHPWFEQSYQDKKNGRTGSTSKADWYEWDEGDFWYNGYRYNGFTDSMPGFNLASPTFLNELDKICKFWIKDHGVKGFRLDAVLYYFQNNIEKNNEFLTWLENTTHKYDKNFYMVGEAWESWGIISQYYQSKLDSFFSFPSATGGESTRSIINTAKGYNTASNFASGIEKQEKKLKENNPNGYSSYFLSNHDQDRITGESEESQTNLRCVASLLALLPGRSYMYYGEEIALKGTRGPNDNTDALRRLPMIWSETNKTGECGFPEPSRKDLDHYPQVSKGIDDKKLEPHSLLNHYRKAINVRNRFPWLVKASFTSLMKQYTIANSHVLAYKLSYSNNSIIVIHNFDSEEITISTDATKIIDSINTLGIEPKFHSNGQVSIAGYSTVIVK